MDSPHHLGQQSHMVLHARCSRCLPPGAVFSGVFEPLFVWASASHIEALAVKK